ncbi:hypothetical protein MMAGJ_35760 [Mycolicibacterium mageritense]|uniref:Uncharacterized protein n=1 Tax=Mycolicibacterium mageritense TaxID=53462 RepID=A0ABM7HUP3_MYCME|nr:hypothetical protein MMAGJ_35760 [Mycolicibacterium mageritense]
MAAVLEVLVGMLVGTRVATADVAARHAHPQVRPATLAEFLALLAPPRGDRLRLGDFGGEVFTGRGRRVLLAPA